MIAVELGCWRRLLSSLIESGTTRLFQRSFRWDIKLCYIQHTNTEQRIGELFSSCWVSSSQRGRSNLRGCPNLGRLVVIPDSLGRQDKTN
jgi:hypothetical protein